VEPYFVITMDYKKLLEKYMKLIDSEEGTTFVRHCKNDLGFSDEEKQVLI
jgi:hypothetical protein